MEDVRRIQSGAAEGQDLNAPVTITRGDFVANVRNANDFESHREFNKIGKPVDRDEWGMTPPTVNAYFNPQMNDINFPAGV